jgi:hypothetical protein
MNVTSHVQHCHKKMKIRARLHIGALNMKQLRRVIEKDFTALTMPFSNVAAQARYYREFGLR